MRKAGVSNISVLHKVREPDKKPNIAEYIQGGKIDLVINIPSSNNNSLNPHNLNDSNARSEVLNDEYTIRRLAVEFNVPVVTNLQLASALITVLEQRDKNHFTIRSLNEYMDNLSWKFW